MAITFVNKGTWAAGTTSISPGIPASMAAGDLMILQVHTCNQAVTTPSGWTQATTSPVSTGTANAAGGTRISVYYRWWQSGDAAPTVAVTGGTVTNGIIVGYRGVDTTTPFDGVTPVATTLATASTTLTMTGLTTTTNNALIHWAIARDQDLSSTTAVTAFTNANLTGITETHDQVVNTGVGGGIWTGRGFKTTAGATGNLTITQTSSIAVGITFALRAAPNNYSITALGGAYTLTGGTATLKRDKHIVASGGSYTLTGASAVITKAAASIRPVRISTTLWQQDTLGTGGTPGAKAITVPADAQGVVVQFHMGGANGNTLSISSDFAGTFTVANTTTQNGCSLGYAPVTSTGAKNLTLSWTQTALEGPSVYISFIKNINTSDWVREVAVVGNDTSGTSATNVFDTSTDDLLLVVNDQDGTDTPATISGFTSLATTDGTYSLPSRLQSCDSPGATTTTVTGTTTNFDILSGISIKPNVNNYTITALGGTYTVSGGSAAVLRSKRLIASGGSYTITGQQATLTWTPNVQAYTLTCLGGSYSLTGSSAILSRNRKLTSSGGTYNITGASATLLRSKRIVASGGTYTLAGGTATLLRSKRLVASGGAYALTGGTATIKRSKYLVATGGEYTITGQQVTITWATGPNAYTLICNGGTYTLTGSQASILRSKRLIASGGSYTYTGSAVTIRKSRYILASGGSYTVVGQAASINKGYLLQAAGGMYQLTGASAILQKSGMVWPLPSQVVLGVQYGPTGFDYTGTMDVLGIKYDIVTGQLVKPISDKVVMTL